MLSTEKAHCPYCGEKIEVLIDCSVEEQNYIEDCFVCCRPITFNVYCDEGTLINLSLLTEND